MNSHSVQVRPAVIQLTHTYELTSLYPRHVLDILSSLKAIGSLSGRMLELYQNIVRPSWTYDDTCNLIIWMNR
jgi:hypothetical protein